MYKAMSVCKKEREKEKEEFEGEVIMKQASWFHFWWFYMKYFPK